MGVPRLTVDLCRGMSVSVNDAYAMAVLAFRTGRFVTALEIATTLTRWIMTSDDARFFKWKRMANVVEILNESARQLDLPSPLPDLIRLD